MNKNSVIFNANLTDNQVTVTEISSSRKINPQLEGACAKRWQETVTKAHLEKKLLWNDTVYRFERANMTNKGLHLKVSTIPFSIRLAMNDYTKQIIALGQDYAPMGMYISSFIVSSDQYYIFIEKSDKYYTTRTLCFVGGVLSKRPRGLKSGKDLFAETKREITEETGIRPTLIKDPILKGGYVNETLNFCLVFSVKTTLSLKQIKTTFGNRSDGEAKRLIGIRKTKLTEFMKLLPKKDHPKFQFVS